MPPEEMHLWYDFLKKTGLSVKRQKIIGEYIVDFCITEANLIIELDGAQHYEAETKEYDKKRDDYLRSRGYTVLRYLNRDINKNFDGVCQDILNIVERESRRLRSATPHQSAKLTASPQGEASHTSSVTQSVPASPEGEAKQRRLRSATPHQSAKLTASPQGEASRTSSTASGPPSPLGEGSICYIIGAGDFFGDFTPDSSDLVIAADGGYDTLKKLGKRCDLLLGDMDSIEENGENAPEKILFPVEKDETDTHLCYLEGVRRGYKKFRIYGGVGGRIDHTFANISLLIYGKHRKSDITLIADGYEIFAIENEKITLFGECGKTFSVFAFEGEAKGVSVIGGKYEAKDVTLSPSFPLGVSNSFLSDKAEISVKDGVLIIMKEN